MGTSRSRDTFANAAGQVPLVLDLRIAQTASGVVLTLVLTDIYITLI